MKQNKTLILLFLNYSVLGIICCFLNKEILYVSPVLLIESHDNFLFITLQYLYCYGYINIIHRHDCVSFLSWLFLELIIAFFYLFGFYFGVRERDWDFSDNWGEFDCRRVMYWVLIYFSMNGSVVIYKKVAIFFRDAYGNI